MLVAIAAVAFVANACGGKKAPPKEPTVTETVSDAGAEEADAGPPPTAEKSLYERLGGKEGVEKIVDSLVQALLADAKVKGRFAKTKGARLERFKTSLFAQLCSATGGPNEECEYEHEDMEQHMRDAHKGMRIREEEWNAFVLDLKLALDENEVPSDVQNDLMALLGPFHDTIVTAKPGKKR